MTITNRIANKKTFIIVLLVIAAFLFLGLRPQALIREAVNHSFLKPVTPEPVYYQNKAVVLLYHDIAVNECGTALSPLRFISHLNMLEYEGFHPVSLERIVNYCRGKGNLPSNAIAITFDDGCASNEEIAFKALQERKWPMAVFVTVAQIGQTPAGSPSRLSWGQLRSMQSRGVLVGSHTYNGHSFWLDNRQQKHYWLRSRLGQETQAAYEERVRTDLVRSRIVLEEELKCPVKHFAAPFGATSKEANRLAAESGFYYLWTTKAKPIDRNSDLQELGRVSVGRQGMTSQMLKQIILQVAARPGK